jgi:hypothetical protein
MGDTGIFGDMKLIGEYYKPDLVLMPIGGHFVMDPQDAAYATKEWLKPKFVIPMHYGTTPGAEGHAAGVHRGARADGREGVSDQSRGQARVLGVARPSGTDDDDLNRAPTEEEWARLQFTTVLYYLHETNPDNGMVRDKTDPRAPVSIAAVGMALATIPVVVERGIVIREFAAKITRRKLRFLLELPQGPGAECFGYKGFFYHFLDIETGGRVWQCELSTIDSAFLFAGALTAAAYFDRDTARRGGDPQSRRRPVPAGRLELGMRWRADADARLATGERIHPRTVGKATTRGCCSTSSVSARRRIRCRRKAIAPIARPISGGASTGASCSTRAPSYTSALAHVGRLSRHT